MTPRRAYSLGPSQLLETSDGGATWRRLSRPPFGFGSPTFVDARRGVAVAGKGDFFRTGDGGRHWLPLRLPAAVLPGVAAFGRRLVAPAERYLPESGGTFRLVVYVSGDGGSTWTARPAPRGWTPVIGTADEQRFSAATRNVWFAAARRTLAVSRDAGRSWRVVRPVGIPPHRSIAAVDFTSGTLGWAIFSGPSQSVLMRTTDGGLHWKSAGPRKPKRNRH